MENVFSWLQKWYELQGHVDLKNNSGIIIDTVDNPGWYLTINLMSTNCQNKPFDLLKLKKNETEWLFCIVRNNIFEAGCDPTSLEKILMVFKNWNESNIIQLPSHYLNMPNVFDELQKWFLKQCDGDWEHEFGVKIYSLYNRGWVVEIDLIGTECENKDFLQEGNNLTQCSVMDGKFVGTGGPQNLSDIIEIFIKWKGD